MLSSGNGEYYLLTSLLIDNHDYYNSQEVRVINNYYVYPNDYEDSDLRAWLNNEFYNTAFAFNDTYVKLTDVDNSAETTNSPNNWWWCNDTQDKVFLPSYQDYINVNYGFTSDEFATTTRKCKTTDYTRARGVYYYKKMNQFYSPYWTRSPDKHKDDIYYAADIDSYGILSGSDVTFSGEAVRPSITLQVPLS